jgi:aspartate aminotransferase
MSLFRLADRMNGIESSPTLRLNAIAQEMIRNGQDVINLTAGETDFPTQPNVNESAIAAIKAGHTRYTPSHGILELRKAAAEWLKRDWNLDYSFKQITTTCGVKQALFNLMLATIGEGDEVIIPSPYWVSYPEMVKLVGGVPVFVDSRPEDGFQISAEAIQKKLNSRTRMLILNSPNNPTGAVYHPRELEKLSRALEGTNVLVASDEIYAVLCYEAAKFIPFASLSKDAYARTITLNGLSKSHAMTGWRVGFAAGNEAIIEALGILQGQSSTNITSFVQYAAIEALKQTPKDFEGRRQNMEERRDLAVNLLRKIPDCKIPAAPQGAFYCFPDLSAYYGRKTNTGTVIQGSTFMAEYLLKEAGIALVPGKPFGEDRCLRLSFARDKKSIEDGITRMATALQKLSP